MKMTAHFELNEFRCRCGVCAWPPSPEIVARVQVLAERLEALRADLGGAAVTVVSGVRCAAHNRAVGGAPRSRHLTGEAADVRVAGSSMEAVAARARALGFGGVGVYGTHVHVDVREGRRAFWRVG